MRRNNFCINYEWGCMWGELSTMEEVDNVAKENGKTEDKVIYMGAYTDRNTNITYSVYYTKEINYLVKR